MRPPSIYALSAIVLLSTIATGLYLAAIAGAPVVSAAPSQVDMDGWSYVLQTDQDDPSSKFAIVQYDGTSVASLKRYAEKNRDLASKLQGGGKTELSVVVSFRKPLAIDDFRAWARAVGMTVEQYSVRLHGSNGEPWSIGGTSDPITGDPVYRPALQRQLDSLAARGVKDIRGVVFAEGLLQSSQYGQVANHPRVFIADVSKSAVEDDSRKAARVKATDNLAVSVPPAYSGVHQS